MKTKNPGAGAAAELHGRKSHDDKIKCFDSESKTHHGRKLKGRIASSLALLLNIYANENYLYDCEKLIVVDNISKAYFFLRNVFSNSASSGAGGNHEFQVDLEYYQESFLTVNERKKIWYPTFVTKYLRNCQRINEISLCKKMTKAAFGEPRIFFIGENSEQRNGFNEHHQVDLVNVASVILKLKKYLKQRCQRDATTFPKKVHAACQSPRHPTQDQSTNISPTTSSTPPHCNKGIQCSKSTEFLKVSPDLKFFSRSSLVINVDDTSSRKPLLRHRPHQQPQLQQQRRREFLTTRSSAAPSLEYVANYRTRERDLPNLRCFSSSAIFGLQSGDARIRSGVAADRSFSERYNRSSSYREGGQRSRTRRRGRPSSDRLRETIRRTEDEMLRYSSFVEDDLISFYRGGKAGKSGSRKSRNLAKEDILSVKKILLEDYITEVQEIIRSESRKIEEEREAKILESVKKRMDEDLAGSDDCCSDSWHSILDRQPSPSKSRSSYFTANESLTRNLPCACCCCCCREGRREVYIGRSRCCCRVDFEVDCSRRESLKECRFCNHERNSRLDSRDGCVVCNENKLLNFDRLKEAGISSAAKSSHSVDSGVHVDYSSHRSSTGDNWPSSSGDDSSRGVLLTGYRGSDKASSEEETVAAANSTCGSCSDEVLCQRVESAVRKFTEELIICERRARDRSRSIKKRRDKRRPFTPTTDQSSGSLFNYLRNSCCSSEDERIAGISTPSLVSLSDSEIPATPPRMPT